MHPRYIEQFADLDASLFDALSRPPEEVDWLRGVLETIDPTLGIRAAFATTIVPLLRRIAPEGVDRFTAYASRFEMPGPFSYIPVRQLLLFVVLAGEVAFPHVSTRESITCVVEAAADLLFALPILGPMIAASGGDFGEFVRALALTQNLFYDHGEMVYERLGPGALLLYYDGQAAHWMELIADPFWRGMMQVLDVEGEVGFALYSDSTSESWMRW